MKVSQFGYMIRTSRLLSGNNMKEMAKAIGVTSSLLSAVELGKRSISEELILNVIKYFNYDDEQEEKLREAAMISQPVMKFNVTSHNDQEKILLHKFAHKVKSLSKDELETFNKLLGTGDHVIE